MEQEGGWLKALITAIVAVGISGSATTALCEESVAEANMEKCFGVCRRGSNDCGARDHSCGGEATKDGDPEEWLLLPKGTCLKIVNGRLKDEE